MQNLQANQTRNTIGGMAQSSMENGLGHIAKGTQMGKSFDGLAILCGFHARKTRQLQDQGGCDQICGEAGL